MRRLSGDPEQTGFDSCRKDFGRIDPFGFFRKAERTGSIHLSKYGMFAKGREESRFGTFIEDESPAGHSDSVGERNR